MKEEESLTNFDCKTRYAGKSALFISIEQKEKLLVRINNVLNVVWRFKLDILS